MQHALRNRPYFRRAGETDDESAALRHESCARGFSGPLPWPSMFDAMPGTSNTGGDICERQRAEIAGQVVSGTLSIQEACAQHQLSAEVLLEWVAALRQSSLTAFDEQVRRTLTDQGVDVSTLATAEFQGDLGEFTIADLIQTLAFGQRDVLITVSQEGRESRIWCAGGEIADAECGKLTGTAAVYRMLALERGRVRASFHRVQRPRKVFASTMELLLEGARRSDECRVLHTKLGAGVHRLAVEPMSGDVSHSADELALLSLFDAPRRVSEVLAESELGDLETLTVLERLAAQGRLVPGAEASLLPPAPPAAAVTSHPPLVTSFTRLTTKRPAARLRWGGWLALGLCALALLLVPRYLVSSGETELSLPVRPAAPTLRAPAEARSAAAGLPTTELPRAPAPPESSSSPPVPSTSAIEVATQAEPPPSSRGATRPRRRTPRSLAPAASGAAPPAASVAGSAAATAETTPREGAAPRMQLIEARGPQMQILE